LKLQCDEPLSNVAFNFNLRRHTEGVSRSLCERGAGSPAAGAARCLAAGFPPADPALTPRTRRGQPTAPPLMLATVG